MTAPAQPSAATRPAWDTRCAAGCGAPVLDLGDRCSACTLALVAAESARLAARVRREWAWVQAGTGREETPCAD